MIFFIIGLGRFGSALAKSLNDKGIEVVAIDRDETKVEEIKDFVSKTYVMDATNEKALSLVGVEDADGVVVCITSSIESSIMTCMILKDKGLKKIMAKAGSEMHAKILRKVGVDRVIFPEQEIAHRLAESIYSPHIFEVIDLSPEYSILERVIPKFMEGKIIRDTKLRTKYGVYIIAIKRKFPVVKDDGKTSVDEKVFIAPSADEEILKGDVIVLLGKKEDIDKFRDL